MTNSEIPWYHRWLLNLPKRTWPAWLKRKVKTETIEIKLWHRDRYDAARVMARYAEEAFTHAWGDEYEIEVTTQRQSASEDWLIKRIEFYNSTLKDGGYGIRHHKNDYESNLWRYLRDAAPDTAKDVNAVCLSHTNARGGGSVCFFSVDTPFEQHPDVGDLWVKPNTGQEDMEIKEFACGPPFGQISSGLHEMGHCVGLGHNIGGTIVFEGKRHATPMPYVDTDCYYLRYSEEARDYSIDVE